MSHFSVTVRLDKSIPTEALKEALAKALMPYKEAGFGSDDADGFESFLKFEDVETGYALKWENDAAKRIVMPDGRLLPRYDEAFKVKDPEGTFGFETKQVVPDHLKEVEVPLKQLYPTFEGYMKDYHGLDARDPKTNRYGHWQNPNAKWDWYAIGGRWPGRIPVKSGVAKSARTTKGALDFQEPGGGADFCRIREIDMSAADAERDDWAAKWWAEWNELLAGKEFDPWSGPRDMAISIGLLSCKDESELTGREWRKVKWDMKGREGEQRYDVFEKVAQVEFDRDYRFAFDGLATYACLDPRRGWISPGEMGWFGNSSDEPRDYLNFKRGFRDWLAGGDQDDWIVMVDCHI